MNKSDRLNLEYFFDENQVAYLNSLAEKIRIDRYEALKRNGLSYEDVIKKNLAFDDEAQVLALDKAYSDCVNEVYAMLSATTGFSLKEEVDSFLANKKRSDGVKVPSDDLNLSVVPQAAIKDEVKTRYESLLNGLEEKVADQPKTETAKEIEAAWNAYEFEQFADQKKEIDGFRKWYLLSLIAGCVAVAIVHMNFPIRQTFGKLLFDLCVPSYAIFIAFVNTKDFIGEQSFLAIATLAHLVGVFFVFWSDYKTKGIKSWTECPELDTKDKFYPIKVISRFQAYLSGIAAVLILIFIVIFGSSRGGGSSKDN